MRLTRLGFDGALLAVALQCLLLGDALALPAGRLWSPLSEMVITGTSEYLGMAQLERSEAGAPYVLMSVKWTASSIRNWNNIFWSESGWRVGPGSTFSVGGAPAVAVSESASRHALALGAEDRRTLQTWLLMFSFAQDSIGPPDSVFATTSQSTEFGGAASSTRRWAVRSDQRQPELQFKIHTLYSDTVGIWHEVERVGVDEDHCAIAPLGDTTAIVVYAGQTGLQYAILDGARWRETGNLDPRPRNAAHPRFRVRPSGGLWLFWESFDWMHVSSYRDGVWDRGDSMQFVPNAGDTYQPAWFSVDHDTTEYPLLAWNNLGYGYTYRDAAVIAFPDGHGWDSPEEIPGSERVGWIEPTVTRDLNDDVWVVWRRASEGLNFWSHTYCVSTCAAPEVSVSSTGARVTWALSSPAPGSRWTVERALGDGPFDSLATVRAGADSVLAWDDAADAPGQTWRYRIRRESVDTAYLWWSEPTSHWRPDTGTALTLSAPAVSSAQLAFRVGGGSGTLTARLYDLQGRLAAEQRTDATGAGDDTVTLDLGQGTAGHSGVYFLRVTDGTGRTTRTARIAVVR